MEEIMPAGKFTQPQLELLRLFSKQYPEKMWMEIRNLLSMYFMEKATEEMDNLFDKKGGSEDKMDQCSICGHLTGRKNSKPPTAPVFVSIAANYVPPRRSPAYT